MWHAARLRKLDVYLARQHPDAPTAWRRAMENSEDLLTSCVFERLGYLPGTLAMDIVLRSAEVRGARFIPTPEAVMESLPWPHPGDDERIEPDWVWLTESYAIVFEAKWGRGVYPTSDQLDAQVRVCKQAWPDVPLVHVAIVQSGQIDAAANRLLVTWSEIRRQALRHLSRTSEHATRRVLADIVDVLEARGIATVWLDSLPAVSVHGTFAAPATPGGQSLRLPELPSIAIDGPTHHGEPWI